MVRRLPWLLLIVLLLARVGSAGSHWILLQQKKRAENQSSSVRETETVTPADRRKRESAAEAKLRSLLEVRAGEMACLRIPPERMEQFVAGIQDVAGPAMNEPSSNAPGLVGIINPALVKAQFSGTAGEIQGSLDASEGDFEWQGGRMQIHGTALRSEQAVHLNFKATEGSNQLECITSAPPGAVVVLKTGGEHPEGVLLVIGGRAE